MEDVLAAQRRYFDSGATRPLRFRREMLTAHAQTLAKAGNKAGKETPYEGAY